VNVAVLTEGWDCPPVSCVVLLRPSSYKSTMIQMIGRGLRKMEPDRFPGRPPKLDCIVLDFGTSVLMHGNLEQEVRLDAPSPRPRTCPACQAEVPSGVRECPLCGHEFLKIERGERPDAEAGDGEDLGTFTLTEIDLFNQSPYRWEDLFNDGHFLCASAFDAWAIACEYRGVWHALGGAKDKGITHLGMSDKLAAIASADDFLRLYGSADDAGKAQRWLYEPMTPKQMEHLPFYRDVPADRRPMKYRAACLLTFKFQERVIRSKLIDATRMLQSAVA
jgi:DNA repair protein RadD